MTCRVCGLSLPDPARLGRLLSQTARLMVGVADYEAYVAHHRTNHPGEPMSREAFFRACQDRRYGVGTGRMMRCC